MKVQLLPSSFEQDGTPSKRQHLTTLIIDDVVAFDAGSLGMAATPEHRTNLRDIVVSHAHLDHIAGLPLFIDDLFAILKEPVRIHASPDVIEVLEDHVFNWKIYPRFFELENQFGPVMEYFEFEPNRRFEVRHLSVHPIEVNHRVPSCGFVIDDGRSVIATTGDTAPTDIFWEQVGRTDNISAVLVECAFPSSLGELASTSFHLTPSALSEELEKLEPKGCRILVTNIKPAYREQTISEINALAIENLEILEVGKVYEF